jgi:hypothetical protein
MELSSMDLVAALCRVDGGCSGREMAADLADPIGTRRVVGWGLFSVQIHRY